MTVKQALGGTLGVDHLQKGGSRGPYRVQAKAPTGEWVSLGSYRWLSEASERADLSIDKKYGGDWRITLARVLDANETQCYETTVPDR